MAPPAYNGKMNNPMMGYQPGQNGSMPLSPPQNTAGPSTMHQSMSPQNRPMMNGTGTRMMGSPGSYNSHPTSPISPINQKMPTSNNSPRRSIVPPTQNLSNAMAGLRAGRTPSFSGQQQQQPNVGNSAFPVNRQGQGQGLAYNPQMQLSPSSHMSVTSSNATPTHANSGPTMMNQKPTNGYVPSAPVTPNRVGTNVMQNRATTPNNSAMLSPLNAQTAQNKGTFSPPNNGHAGMTASSVQGMAPGPATASPKSPPQDFVRSLFASRAAPRTKNAGVAATASGNEDDSQSQKSKGSQYSNATGTTALYPKQNLMMNQNSVAIATSELQARKQGAQNIPQNMNPNVAVAMGKNWQQQHQNQQQQPNMTSQQMNPNWQQQYQNKQPTAMTPSGTTQVNSNLMQQSRKVQFNNMVQPETNLSGKTTTTQQPNPNWQQQYQNNRPGSAQQQGANPNWQQQSQPTTPMSIQPGMQQRAAPQSNLNWQQQQQQQQQQQFQTTPQGIQPTAAQQSLFAMRNQMKPSLPMRFNGAGNNQQSIAAAARKQMMQNNKTTVKSDDSSASISIDSSTDNNNIPITSPNQDQQMGGVNRKVNFASAANMIPATAPQAVQVDDMSSSDDDDGGDNRAVSTGPQVDLSAFIDSLHNKKNENAITAQPMTLNDTDSDTDSDYVDSSDDENDDAAVLPHETEDQLTSFINSLNKPKEKVNDRPDLDPNDPLDAIILEARGEVEKAFKSKAASPDAKTGVKSPPLSPIRGPPLPLSPKSPIISPTSAKSAAYSPSDVRSPVSPVSAKSGKTFDSVEFLRQNPSSLKCLEEPEGKAIDGTGAGSVTSPGAGSALSPGGANVVVSPVSPGGMSAVSRMSVDEPEGTTAVDLAKLNHYVAQASELSETEDCARETVVEIIENARKDGFDDDMINEIFAGVLEKATVDSLGKIVQEAIEASAGKELAEEDLANAQYISEAMDLARSSLPLPEDINTILKEAKLDGVEANVILQAFDEACRDLKTGKDIISTDEDSPLSKVSKYCKYIKEAIALEAGDEYTQDEMTQFLEKVKEDGFSTDYITEIFDAPVFVNDDEDGQKKNSDLEDKKLNMIIALKHASLLACETGSWEDNVKFLLKDAEEKGLPVIQIKNAFINAKQANIEKKEIDSQTSILGDKYKVVSNSLSLDAVEVGFLNDELVASLSLEVPDILGGKDTDPLSMKSGSTAGSFLSPKGMSSEDNASSIMSSGVKSPTGQSEYTGDQSMVDSIQSPGVLSANTNNRSISSSMKSPGGQSMVDSVQSPGGQSMVDSFQSPGGQSMVINDQSMIDSVQSPQQSMSINDQSMIDSPKSPGMRSRSDSFRSPGQHSTSHDAEVFLGVDGDDDSEKSLNFQDSGEFIKLQTQRQSMMSEHTLIMSKSSVNSGPHHVDGIAAVAAVKALESRKASRTFRLKLPVEIDHAWKMPMQERRNLHPGFTSVNAQSIYDTSIMFSEPHRFDNIPWERRDVQQFFLYEKSLDVIQNWFGTMPSKRFNKKAREPISHPRSVIMDIATNPAEWDEEWYTTWQARKDNPNRLILHGKKDNEKKHGKRKSRSRKSKHRKKYADDESFDLSAIDLPEIGSIYTIRFRIGERVSRVHYEYTSSLRKSRWKKKYFPKGVFGT